MGDERRKWFAFNRDPGEQSAPIDAGRLVSFSDGVFAIAITLLVLSINVPDLSGSQVDRLGESLHDSIDSIAAYLLSFAVVGRFWIGHHRLLGQVAQPDGRLAMLNLAYLAVIVFIPYPTELVGRYGDQFPAFAMYASTMALAVLAGLAINLYVHRKGLLRADAPRYRVGDILVSSLVPTAIFLASIPLALVVDTSYAYLAWLALVLVNPSVRIEPR